MSDQPTPEKIPPSAAPYLLRAIWQWITDQLHTPYLLVNALHPGVQVPKHAITADGKITLNVADRSVKYLKIDNDAVSFGAAFGGRHFNVYIPMEAIVAIYDRETSNGFALENYHAKPDQPKEAFGFKPPSLAVVSSSTTPEASIEDAAAAAGVPMPAEEPPVKPVRSRGHLSVVK